jgi:repressor LexA
MINAGIFDGDYLVVNQQHTAEDGDIVVALLNDEDATVKRFFKEQDCIRLQPENELMEPIRSNDVVILGKVVGVFRKID